MSDGARLTGKWYVRLYGPDGELKDQRQGTNVVTTNGLDALASFLQSATVTASTNTWQYIGIGSDATAEAASNTALGTELARHTGTVSYLSGGIYQVSATFATGVGTGNIAEYGLFSSNAAGTMLTRDTESAIAKGANDTLLAVHQITFS